MKTQTTQKTKVKHPIPKASKGSSRFMMLVIGTILFFLITMVVNVAKSQNTYPYTPDRPGFAANPYLVGLHQMDYSGSVGYNYFVYDGTPINTLTQTNLVRYGMFKHLEIRAGVDFTRSNPFGEYIYAVRDVNLGVKVPIYSGSKYFPDVALLGTVMLPNLGTPEVNLTEYCTMASLLLQKGVGRWQFLANGGVLWDAFSKDGISMMNVNSVNHKMQWSYVVAAYCYVIKDKLAIFAETYGYASQYTKPFAGFDGGLSLSITPELEWDCAFGIDYERGLNNAFVNTGVGIRIPNKNK